MTQKKKKALIDESTTEEDMLQLDIEGADLSWDPDDFQEISEETLKKLRKSNRDRYLVFRELAEEAKSREPEDDEIVSSIKVSADAGRAASKLDIKDRKPGYRYRWERPDMVDVRLEQGYRRAKGIKTLRGKDSKGVHRIGSNGQDELVALEISEEAFEKHRDRRKARRDQAREGIAQSARSQIERLGSSPVDDTTKGTFSPISREEETNG